MNTSLLIKYALYEATNFVAKSVGEVTCVADCRATRASWFYDNDVIWLQKAYVNASCMSRCIESTKAAFQSVTQENATDFAAKMLDKLLEVAAIKEHNPYTTIAHAAFLATGVYIAGKYLYKKLS